MMTLILMKVSDLLKTLVLIIWITLKVFKFLKHSHPTEMTLNQPSLKNSLKDSILSNNISTILCKILSMLKSELEEIPLDSSKNPKKKLTSSKLNSKEDKLMPLNSKTISFLLKNMKPLLKLTGKPPLLLLKKLKLNSKHTEISIWMKLKDSLMMLKLLTKLSESSSKNSKVLMTSSETNNTMKLVLLMMKDSVQECSVELMSKLMPTQVLEDGMPPLPLDPFDHDFILS